VKGSKTPGPDFLNAGDEILDGLELGSSFTWYLALNDLVGPVPYYGKGPDTPYVSVFIGNQPYEGLASVANDPGTDGTVRWAGCGLNTRKITIDLTRTPTAADRATIGKSLQIKGEVIGSESLYIDGKVEGAITLPDSRVTVSRDAQVSANITAREVVVFGKVFGNITASDRVDIRNEGSVTGDVTAQRIIIGDGAFFKGGMDISKPADKMTGLWVPKSPPVARKRRRRQRAFIAC
jgi:cytoskeletal protein CcmA (bactofilin family)